MKRVILVAACLVAWADRDAQADKIYWTEAGTIKRANPDGTNVEVVLSGVGFPKWMDIDSVNRKIYWTDYSLQVIRRSNIDGSDWEHVVSTGFAPRGIALDVANNTMYWAESSGPQSNCGIIRSATLSGTDIDNNVVCSGSCHCSLSNVLGIDVAAGFGVYWAAKFCDRVYRLSNWMPILVAGEDVTSDPEDVAIDVIGEQIFWTDTGGGVPGNFTNIYSADLDGSNVEILVDLGGNNGAGGLAMADSLRRLYWAEGGHPDVHIRFIDLESMDPPSTIITGVVYEGGIAFYHCPGNLNNDAQIDAADLALLLGSWGPCMGCTADLNMDGEVNAADLALLLGAWGPGC